MDCLPGGVPISISIDLNIGMPEPPNKSIIDREHRTFPEDMQSKSENPEQPCDMQSIIDQIMEMMGCEKQTKSMQSKSEKSDSECDKEEEDEPRDNS